MANLEQRIERLEIGRASRLETLSEIGQAMAIRRMTDDQLLKIVSGGAPLTDDELLALSTNNQNKGISNV